MRLVERSNLREEMGKPLGRDVALVYLLQLLPQISAGYTRDDSGDRGARLGSAQSVWRRKSPPILNGVGPKQSGPFAVGSELTSVIYSLLEKVADRLPDWGKVIFWTVLAIVGVYGSISMIAKYGLGSFLLRVIFSP